MSDLRMSRMVPDLCRTLLLLGLLGGASLRCLGQGDIDFSVAGPLLPNLTDTSANDAPPTTLSIDLLAPQRSFTYDSTGSNVLASSLDPTVRVDLWSAEAETDTAIRDSVQTGQLSPYAWGGSRLSTLFSQAGSTTDSRNGASSQTSVESTAASANLGDQQPYGADSGNSAAEMTGSASQIRQLGGGTTYGSSWGGRSSANAQFGSGSSGGAGSSAPLGSGYQSGSSLSADRSAVASADVYRTRPAPAIGWKPGGLSLSRPTSNGVASMNSRVPTTFGAGSTERFIARPGQSQDSYADPASLPGAQPGSGISQQPGAEGSARIGSSPSSGFGSVDFFQPNILGASRPSFAPRGRDRSSSENRSRSKLKGEDNDNPLETSASNYGLKSASKSARSRSPRGKAAKRTNPYLAGDNPAPDESSN